MVDDRTTEARPAPRYRNVSGRPLNRRVVMKAAAGLSAMVAAGTFAVPSPSPERAAAQQISGTRSREWYAAENVGETASSALGPDEWITFEAEFSSFIG